MRDWLTMLEKSSPTIVATRVCAGVSLAAMFVYMFAVFFVATMALTVIVHYRLQLEGAEGLAMVLVIASDSLTGIALLLNVAGVFVLRRTLKPVALCWICLSADMLLGNIIVPLISDNYSPAKGVTDIERIFHYILLVLLVIAPALIGVLFLMVEKLLPVKKWMLLGACAVCAVLYIISVVMCGRTGVGSVGMNLHLPSVFAVVSDPIMILTVLASAVLLIAAMKSPDKDQL